MHSFLYSVFFGFLGGILFHSFITVPLFEYLVFVCAAVVGLYALFLSRREVEAFKFPIHLFLILLACGFGMLRFDSASHFPLIFEDRIEERVVMEGIVVKESEKRDEYARVVFLPDTLSGEDILNKKTKILFQAAYPAPFEYGDRISVAGTLKKPWEGEGNFNYPMYLAKDGVFYEIKNAEAELLQKEAGGNSIKRFLFSIKNKFLKNIQISLSEPGASLIGGILLGIKGSLGENFTDALRAAGVIHIIVLSGFNITIVASSMMWLFSYFFSKRIALTAASMAIVLFAIMVGAGATVVRASGMALLVLLARFLNRRSSIINLLLITGIIMSAINPLIVAFDVSFQLSFLATLGLILLSPVFEKMFSFITQKIGLREIVSATVATQLFVFPILLYNGGQFSLVSLPANILILPFIPLVMFLGFLTGLFGFLGTALSFPFSFLTSLFLSYMIVVVNFFASFPMFSFTLTAGGLFLLYIFLAIFVWFLYKKGN